jgi:hypothetical protein
VWRRARAVEFAHLAIGIEQIGSRRRVVLGDECIRAGAVQVALLAVRAGVDREPDDAVGDRIGLLLLHVAAAVMLAHERTFRIVPLEHHGLALVLRERLRLAVAVRDAEVRDGLADGHAGRCRHGEGKSEQ